MGRVYNKDLATKNISSISFRTGAVTFNVASVLTVSLQNLSATGVPMRVSESVLQSGTLTGVALVANSWNTVTLGSNLTGVTLGQALGVCFDITTFNASDSVLIASWRNADNTQEGSLGVSKKTTGTWASANSFPNIVFGFDDGTFGTFFASLPISTAPATAAFYTGSSPNEYGMQFTAPFSCKVVGAWAQIQHTTSAAIGTLSLYDSNSNSLASAAIGTGDLNVTGSPEAKFLIFGSEVTLIKGNIYYLGLAAGGATTSGDTMLLWDYTLGSAAHFQAHSNADTCYLVSRTNTGAWSTTTTARPMMGVIISRLDDGNGASGGASGSGAGFYNKYDALNRF
jgi:hypothetical protein